MSDKIRKYVTVDGNEAAAYIAYAFNKWCFWYWCRFCINCFKSLNCEYYKSC